MRRLCVSAGERLENGCVMKAGVSGWTLPMRLVEDEDGCEAFMAAVRCFDSIELLVSCV
jgi:hypothetical protein